MENCYDAIPIEQNWFVHTRTRVATKNAAKIECNNFFPNTILTMEGWVTINPHIKPSASPRNISLIGVNINHESLAHGGIYTEQELAAWEAQIQFQTFHEAVSRGVSYGVCIAQEKCESQESVESYDLSNLVTEVEESTNIFKKIDNWIKQYSGIIGVVVILGWVIKMVIYATIITSTIVKDGINETIALVYATLCFVPYTAGRIRRKAKRIKVPTRDYPEDLKMDNRESFIYSPCLLYTSPSPRD